MALESWLEGFASTEWPNRMQLWPVIYLATTQAWGRPGSEGDESRLYRFVPLRYISLQEFAFIKVFDGDRLAAIVRPPTAGLIGERPDHWRMDCGEADYTPANTALREAVCAYVGSDKVSVFWPWRGWNDQDNTEPFPPSVDWRATM